MTTEQSDHTITPGKITFTQSDLSEWHCYLFGSTDDNGLIWRPRKGNEPHWFWRNMQYICFGNRWVKK